MMSNLFAGVLLTQVVLTVFIKCVNSQEVIAVNTIPSSMIVSQPENATDVSILCEVVRVGFGLRATNWRIRRPGDAMDTLLQFNSTGTGFPGSENFFIPDTTQRANLTIRVFDASLNGANITCGAGNDIAVNGTFRLRIISECSPDPLYI